MTGKKISIKDGNLQVPDHPIIPFIEGDGIGPEIWGVAQKVIDKAVKVSYNGLRSIQWKEILAGQKAFDHTGEWLPQATIAAIDLYRLFISGPLVTPLGGGIRSLNVALQGKFDLYASIRPISHFSGVPTPFLHPEHIDTVVFRENTEGIQTGISARPGTEKAEMILELLEDEFPEDFAKLRFGSREKVMAYVDQLPFTHPARVEVGISLQATSRQGSERLFRSAIQYALQQGRKSLSLIHNGNALKFTEGAFRDWSYQLAEREFGSQVFTWASYDRIAAIDGHAAARQAHQAALQEGRLIIRDMLSERAIRLAIENPAELDVLVAPGIHGEMLGQLLSSQVAGNGLLPIAHINGQSQHALFEPSHGPIAALAKKNQMNPSSMILAGGMLLSHIGWREAGQALEQAVRSVLANRQMTQDLAAKLEGVSPISCTEFGEAVLQQLG